MNYELQNNLGVTALGTSECVYYIILNINSLVCHVQILKWKVTVTIQIYWPMSLINKLWNKLYKFYDKFIIINHDLTPLK